MLTIENIHIHMGPAAAQAAASAIFSQPIKASVGIVSPAVIPRIGEYWKGQGGIYVGLDRGFDDEPDGHLILPIDSRAYFKERALLPQGKDAKGAYSARNGHANTVALAEAGSELCEEIRALEIEGHKDFFLPAQFQAALIYANVREAIELGEWYRTSTMHSPGFAWYQYFDNGDQYGDNVSALFRARACRRLIL